MIKQNFVIKGYRKSTNFTQGSNADGKNKQEQSET
ncbi:hypothetical protein WCLE_007360 [Wolbachia endosymbiont of Cimex lectularius]|nr:hypothetical protein WCLE_007360 [Wolbachia endosymbiont of Cimex lectularius]